MRMQAARDHQEPDQHQQNRRSSRQPEAHVEPVGHAAGAPPGTHRQRCQHRQHQRHQAPARRQQGQRKLAIRMGCPVAQRADGGLQRSQSNTPGIDGLDPGIG